MYNTCTSCKWLIYLNFDMIFYFYRCRHAFTELSHLIPHASVLEKHVCPVYGNEEWEGPASLSNEKWCIFNNLDMIFHFSLSRHAFIELSHLILHWRILGTSFEKISTSSWKISSLYHRHVHDSFFPIWTWPFTFSCLGMRLWRFQISFYMLRY